jgi:phosphatidylglycerophosphate synthase
MTTRPRVLLRVALAAGILLFIIALRYTDWSLIVSSGPRLLLAIAAAVLFSGLWHIARTVAWAWCFSSSRRIGFLRLFRVRIAAEAVSYVTLRGIVGEPLKVVLLAEDASAREVTASIALERLAYTIGTTIIVGVGSLVALGRLPLTPVWTRVFTGFAIGAAVFAVLTLIVLTGKGTYLGRLRGIRGSSWPARAARFTSDVETLLLQIARENPRRLAVLAGMTVTSYLLMSLEAWAVLRAMGIPVTFTGAVAIETFSRVASFASAFIPANLGALEAASLAAVSAAGVAGGGPLALARRVRGLFWAAFGFSLYPRHLRPAPQAGCHTPPSAGMTTPTTLLYIVEDDAVSVSPLARIAGLPIAERVLRAAVHAGYDRVLVYDPRGIIHSIARRIDADIRPIATADEWRAAVQELPAPATLTAVGAGTVVSSALLKDAMRIFIASGEVESVAAGPPWPETGVLRVRGAAASDIASLAGELRLRAMRPAPLPTGDEVSGGTGRLAIRVRHAADLPRAEETLRRATFKSTDAKVARFNRRMSLPISIILMRTPLTANQMSTLLVGLGFWAAWLFSRGHYSTGVFAAFLSLAASVLDGCDGEIARLKYQESALGCWLETFGDYSYYLAIFAGLTIGSVRQTGAPFLLWIGGVGLFGTLASFAVLIFLRSRITAGQPETLHAVARARFMADQSWWSSFTWRLSFVATRAAMPYGIMALALVHLLPVVVVLSAIGANLYWVSLVLKLRHLLAGESTEAVAA